ncbi:hypothetical protein [Bacillus paramycoides]|uniref:hypothetical protein n=1 Tax=Bacillus paramycoides TaxID=2026194 RepID=UPI002E22A225|nr:hypothetical protein [Bacillus paramycoides]
MKGTPSKGLFLYSIVSTREEGEPWPAVYEKAYVKWITGDQSDYPDISKIRAGDSVSAIVNLTGLSPMYFSTNDMSEEEIWHEI